MELIAVALLGSTLGILLGIAWETVRRPYGRHSGRSTRRVA